MDKLIRLLNDKKLFMLVLTVIVGISLTSCKTKYVTVPEVHTEYITKNTVDIVRDTLIQRDSVYHYVNGDTVVITKIKNIYHATPVYHSQTDTIIKTDTITKVVTVEGKSSGVWKMFGKFSLFVFVIGLVAAVSKLLLNRIKL